MAKATAGEAQRIIAQDGIQPLGGIGFTWEHDMHLWVKRAKSGDSVFGTAADHRQRIFELVNREGGARARGPRGRKPSRGPAVQVTERPSR